MSDEARGEESPEEQAAKERREKQRAYKREWIAKNPERHRQHSRDSAARKKAADERRAKESARVRRWRDANPDKVRANSQAWLEANREKRREIDRASYHRNKERRRAALLERQAESRADPAQAAKRKAWRDNNREHLNELQRKRRAENPEAMREYNREWRRIEKRRIELELPKVRKRRKTALEALTNENQAAEYFARRMTKSRLRKITEEGRLIAFDTAVARDTVAKRVENRAERALGGYLVHQAAPELIKAEYAMINVPGFREELRMDLVARQARGGPPFDLDAELWRAAGQRVFERMNSELGLPIYVPPEARKERQAATPSAPPAELSAELREMRARKGVSFPGSASDATRKHSADARPGRAAAAHYDGRDNLETAR